MITLVHFDGSKKNKMNDNFHSWKKYPSHDPLFKTIYGEEIFQLFFISFVHKYSKWLFLFQVCPGREGPIFFGDDHRGHVLSYTFYVQDSHARGLQRWFSIIVVMMDKIYLLNSWPFLVQHIRDIIEKVQTQASAVYEEEQVKCPQRAHRLTKSMNPTNFRLHRGGNKPARSLVELTNDKNLFQILHSRFTWILKACGNRLTERLLEGPPTEDSIIDLENQEGKEKQSKNDNLS